MLGLSLIVNPQSKLDWPGAIAEFRAALKIRPHYPEALDYLGVGLTATGQTDLAISELEKAIRLKPLMPSTHFNLATAFENILMPGQASPWFDLGWVQRLKKEI
jgi:Flp pilus assembly protein TadD